MFGLWSWGGGAFPTIPTTNPQDYWSRITITCCICRYSKPPLFPENVGAFFQTRGVLGEQLQGVGAHLLQNLHALRPPGQFGRERETCVKMRSRNLCQRKHTKHTHSLSLLSMFNIGALVPKSGTLQTPGDVEMCHEFAVIHRPGRSGQPALPGPNKS